MLSMVPEPAATIFAVATSPGFERSELLGCAGKIIKWFDPGSRRAWGGLYEPSQNPAQPRHYSIAAIRL
jgi:hypothetical protein